MIAPSRSSKDTPQSVRLKLCTEFVIIGEFFTDYSSSSTKVNLSALI